MYKIIQVVNIKGIKKNFVRLPTTYFEIYAGYFVSFAPSLVGLTLVLPMLTK